MSLIRKVKGANKDMWKKYALPMIIGALVSVSWMSCEKDPDDPENPGKNDVTTSEVSLKNPQVEKYHEGDYEKDYLQDSALKFLQYFNANDQRPLIQLASYYSEELSDYDFPESLWSADNSRAEDATRDMMRTFASSNYLAYTRAIYTYTFNMARFKGVYEPNTRKREWGFIANSDDFVLRFTDDFSKECVVTVSGSKDTWSHEMRVDQDYIVLDVPKTLRLTIVRGNETLVDVKVKSNYNRNSSFTAEVEGNVMNLAIKTITNGNNSEIKETAQFGVNGVRIASTEATINGNNLCNPDSWESTYDRYYDGNEALARMISGATGKVSILDQVFINGKIVNIRNFAEYLDFWADNYDYDDPESEARKAAKTMNSAVESSMSFAGSDKVQAVLGWEPYLDYEGYYYTEWCIRPVFTFNTDGSSYDFESYFGNNHFFKVENLWENIIDKYLSIF